MARRIERLIDFGDITWINVIHDDGTLIEQPVPTAFARPDTFAAKLERLGFGQVRLNDGDPRSLLQRVKLELRWLDERIRERNRFKRSGVEGREWNERHEAIARRGYALKLIVEAAWAQMADPQVRRQMAAGQMPALKTISQLDRERTQARWRHGQAMARLRDAESEALRLKRLPRDIAEEIRGMEQGFPWQCQAVGNQQMAEG